MRRALDRAKPPFWFLDLIMWWKRMQRDVDRQFLIPAMESRCATDFDLAAVFALHMALDTAWQVESWQYTDWEWEFLERLNAA